MRASRLLSIVLLLQSGGPVTAQELADALEVSVRTIYRDVVSLQAAGVPVQGDAGRQGGYRLQGGYETRLTGLTASETHSLFLLGLPAAAADLGLGHTLAAAELKLTAALPAEYRERAHEIRQRFHLDAPAWYGEADQTPWLTAVAGAVWDRRSVRIRYLRWAEPQEVTRTLQPLGLVLKAGRWYLVAARDGQLRTYRVSRIAHLDVIEERFERPPSFDLAGHWARYQALFDARRQREQAVLRLSPAALALVPHVMEPAVARAVAATTGAPDDDGWVRVTIPIESIEHAAREVLKLGADAEVLRPPPLRERVSATIGALARIYVPATD